VHSALLLCISYIKALIFTAFITQLSKLQKTHHKTVFIFFFNFKSLYFVTRVEYYPISEKFMCFVKPQ